MGSVNCILHQICSLCRSEGHPKVAPPPKRPPAGSKALTALIRRNACAGPGTRRRTIAGLCLRRGQRRVGLVHMKSCLMQLYVPVKVLDPILWSNHNYSTPLQPNHRRHTFTTAAAVCLGCGLSLNITCETYNLHWALRVTCTIEMFVTPSSTHVVLFIH